MDDFDTTPKVDPAKVRVTHYPNRPVAQTAVNRGMREFAEKGVYDGMAQFEPNKGFVAVLFAEKNVPDAWDAGFEVVTKQEMKTPTPTDPSWNMPKPRHGGGSSSKSSGSTGGPPVKGATAKVWKIADELHAEKPLTRADRPRVIAKCEEEGINKSTAATQWSKWAKDKGL